MLSLIGLCLAIWAFAIEPGRLVVVEQELELPGWTAPPLRVAVLSDLHVGAPHVDLAFLNNVIARTNSLEPDLVLLAGDFLITGVAGGEFIGPKPIAEALARLSAPMGVYAVLGNHDWWFDGPKTAQALENAGSSVLENESVVLNHKGGKVRLIGLGDHMTDHADPQLAYGEAPAVEGPTIVFTHSPDVFPELAAMGLDAQELTIAIAGHTHGGQVWVPLLGTPVVPSQYGSRFVRGHIVEGDSHYFVTSGVGTSIVPARFAVPPEIVLLTLR
ncbi:MAG: metallophosphoesterase [Nannocystaceae bacterium]